MKQKTLFWNKGNVDVSFVRSRLLLLYGAKPETDKRKLFVHQSLCNYNQVGYVFFALEGSPPKGAAIYNPERHFLVFIDAWGSVSIIQNICIEGVE